MDVNSTSHHTCTIDKLLESGNVTSIEYLRYTYSIRRTKPVVECQHSIQNMHALKRATKGLLTQEIIDQIKQLIKTATVITVKGTSHSLMNTIIFFYFICEASGCVQLSVL